MMARSEGRRTTGAAHTLSLVVCAGFAGCGGDLPEAAGGASFEVIDSLSHPVAVNRGAAPRWELGVDFTVGVAGSGTEPAPDEFGQITSVAIGPGGDIWVADGLERTIKVFGADGSFVRRIGRQGEGPGEFSGLYSIGFVGDTALVLDFGNGRIAELSREGEWLGQRDAPGGISGSPAQLRFFALDAHVVAQWSLDVSDGEMQRLWVAHDASGPGERWSWAGVEAPPRETVVCERTDGAISFFSPPFAPTATQIPAAVGSQWVGSSTEYEIAELASAGDTLRVVRRERDPVPITDAEWAEGTREFEDFREEWQGRASCEPRDFRRPEFKAAFRSLLRSTSGELWVETYTAEGFAWEVFDADGRLVGSVPGFAYDERVAPYIDGRRIVWVERDELGVQRVMSGVAG